VRILEKGVGTPRQGQVNCHNPHATSSALGAVSSRAAIGSRADDTGVDGHF
jgi:hypothetical protein